MSSKQIRATKKTAVPTGGVNNNSVAASATGSGSALTRCCCNRFVSDWSLPLFGLQEPTGTIDVEASFSPSPRCRTLTLKICLAAWTLSMLVTDLFSRYEGTDERKYYLIYLTNWCHLFTVIYTWLSLLLSIVPARLLTKTTGDTNSSPGFIVRVTWGMFSAVATMQVVVVLLFWLLEYGGSDRPSYSEFMKHGGFMVLVVLEGLVLNSIPIRAKHIVFPTLAAIMYSIWTFVHAVLDIGNPFGNDDDVATDDDAIYGVINWRKRPELSIGVIVIATFVVLPVIFLTLWIAAKDLRRYADTTSNSNIYKRMSA